MRKKKEEADDAPVDADTAPGPLTPRDIQEKVFRTQAGLRGYNEREVDEFLDRITEEFARMHAENQRLRSALAAGAGGVPRGAVGSAAGDGSRGQEVTGAFVAREREFLRNLATLIQNHAEAVKQDIGRTRAPAPAAPAAAAPGAAAAPPAAVSEPPAPVVPVPAPAVAAPAPAVPAPVPGGQAALPSTPEPAGLPSGPEAAGIAAPAPAEPALDLAGGHPEPVMAGAEPAPAKGGPDEQTIRELFWGEE